MPYRTTPDQLKEAPFDCVFVWISKDLDRPTYWANSLGRIDIKIVPPSWVIPENFKGLLRKVLVDDNTMLTREQLRLIVEHRNRFLD